MHREATGITRRGRIAATALLVLAQCVVAIDRPASAAAIASVRDGAWSDPSTWDLGRAPGPLDRVTVRHRVKLDRNASVAGANIAPAGKLVFAPRASRTLTTTGNVVVEGVLRMRPASARRTHRLLFEGVNEALFVGGGHEPVASDVGLWVRPSGRLAASGAGKASWTRATGSIRRGATSFRVKSARGWRRGDEIALGPTRPDELREAFEVLTVARVNARRGRVVLTSPTARSHVNVRLPNGRNMRPEVLNLTRNVRIEGTPGGRTHVHIFRSRPHKIRHIALRHVGVPVGDNANAGRYGLHFHHAGDRSRGTVVKGVVIRDIGTHGFVAHASHGITFRRTIAYNFDDAAYWWDRLEADGSVSLTHDNNVERCVAANGVGAGIVHQFGLRNSMVGCVAYGIANTGNGVAGKGFAWDGVPTNQEPFREIHAVWKWRDGIAHNVANPVWVWQNTGGSHNVVRPIGYWPAPPGRETSTAYLHGAYRNVYHYISGVMMGNIPLSLHAASGVGRTDPDRRQVHRRMIYDAAGGDYAIRITRHGVPSTSSGLVVGCTVQNFTRAAVVINEQSSNEFSQGADYTFRNCTKGNGSPLSPQDFLIEDLHPDSEICIENAETAWMIDGSGTNYDTRRVSSCP